MDGLKESHQKYLDWIDGLRVGDEIEVQHPWDDHVYVCGHRSPGAVVGGCGVGGLDIRIEYEYRGAKRGTCVRRASGGTGYEQIAPIGIEVMHDWSVGYYIAGEPRKRANNGR